MSKGNPSRHIRVPDALWLPFMRATQQRGTTASAVILAAIRTYLERSEKEQP